MKPRGVFLDLDGTVCLGESLLPGAIESIDFLRRERIPFLFLSNSLDDRREYAARLTRLGLPTSPDDILHAPLALERYLERHLPEAVLHVIGLPSLLDQLSPRFRLSDDPAQITVVVASIDHAFDYRKLNLGFQALRHGARFLATNLDRTWPTPHGAIPDAGAIVGALEACSGRRVEVVVGKPSAWMAGLAMEHLQCPAAESWVVGDSLESDVAMGWQAGMTTALVLTGAARRGQVGEDGLPPDHVLDSLVDLPALLEAVGRG
jgi:arabinose operon protein AraL